MYRVAVRKEFVAQHYLIGGDWGAENQVHSHPYRLELELGGETLDQHGFLVDIVEINRHLDGLIARYRDRTLNDLHEFQGLNPSIEHFTRILCEQISAAIQAENVCRVTVRLWENDNAWASFKMAR